MMMVIHNKLSFDDSKKLADRLLSLFCLLQGFPGESGQQGAQGPKGKPVSAPTFHC